MRRNRYLNCLKLNLRALSLAMKGQWLSPEHVAASYNCVADHYDTSWLVHLRSKTDRLLSLLPAPPSSLPIIDLGCGTGYTTGCLASSFDRHDIKAVDCSQKMLGRAREKNPSTQIDFIRMDMLEFMQSQPAHSASMIVSGWAIGYSNPAKIFHEAQRVLPSNGILAFIVNFRDTLKPIFMTLRKTMASFPGALKRVTLPKYPKDFQSVAGNLRKSGFEVQANEDGYQPIEKPSAEPSYLRWILKTGVLAGFDAMLPLKEKGPVGDYFDTLMNANPDPIEHHYLMVIARRK